MAENIKRLSGQKTLYELLPKGAEGGKEFARIVDLLLFHQAKRTGSNLTLFSDRSGDWNGLDSFESPQSKPEERIGYQYKFFPSPLSSKHRSEIRESLEKAVWGHKESKIKKWVLILPEDLPESKQKKEGGDVSWFTLPKMGMSHPFEIEYWGHTKLQALFLETWSLCLFYYPGLIPEGFARRKTIQEVRHDYDNNMRQRYNRIEFVGMSVYKPEATRGVAMEHIYIPLSTIPEQTEYNDTNTQRINPLNFLEPGSKTVILGDPGSGKSTLLRFMALSGISNPLQKAFKCEAHDRLPVLLVLRQYADELKTNPNLSLLDFIRNRVQAEFSLKAANDGFFEYYLESGQSILLFDGLDELSDPHFKIQVRDRIMGMLTTYPHITAVITSRNIGYDNAVRFDNAKFQHRKIAPLRLPEIKTFIQDWFRVRVESENIKKIAVEDLVTTIAKEENQAIRVLAENPLLLTIIVLVYRVDAVLPDERVVLYKKCVETLLITWQVWKYKEFRQDHNRLNKEERRRSRRIEAIAQWMHEQAGEKPLQEQKFVDYKSLLNFLTYHIKSVEKQTDSDIAEDDAAVFLEFVKNRAGLLVEAGNNSFSFVHLTFQEYLTASHIITQAERKGDVFIWQTIQPHCGDPRWHEVIRLLIAARRSNESQEYLLEEILTLQESSHHTTICMLLGGLLQDCIIAAEQRAPEILFHLILAARQAGEEASIFREISTLLRTWIKKNERNVKVWNTAFEKAWQRATSPQSHVTLLHCAFASGIEEKILEPWLEILRKTDEQSAEWIRYLLLTKSESSWSEPLINKMQRLPKMLTKKPLELSYVAFIAPVGGSLFFHLEPINRTRCELLMLMALITVDQRAFSLSVLGGILLSRSPSERMFGEVENLSKALSINLSSSLSTFQLRSDILSKFIFQSTSISLPIELSLYLSQYMSKLLSLSLYKSQIEFLDTFVSTSDIYDPVLQLTLEAFNLHPQEAWRETLRVRFIPHVPDRLPLYQSENWQEVLLAFQNEDSPSEITVYQASSQLLLDVGLYFAEHHDNPEESPFKELAELTCNSTEPPLVIAHTIRDLAYVEESKSKEIADKLKKLLNSTDPAYRKIFEDGGWLETEEEKRIPKTETQKQGIELF